MGHLAKLFPVFAERPGWVPHPFLRLLASTAVAAIERRAACVPNPIADASTGPGTADPPLAEKKTEKAAAEEKGAPLDDAGPSNQVNPPASKGSREEAPPKPPRWTTFEVTDADKVPNIPLLPHEQTRHLTCFAHRTLAEHATAEVHSRGCPKFVRPLSRTERAQQIPGQPA